jgi:hypothetical protein
MMQREGPPTREPLNPVRPRSKDDAAPEPRVPAEACAADDRRRYDDGRGSHHYRGRHDGWSNDDNPIRAATSIRAAVKTDSASSFSLGTERRQGRAQHGTSKSKNERFRHRLPFSLNGMFARNKRLDEDGQTRAPVKVAAIFIPIVALPVRRSGRIANIRGQVPRFVQSFAAFQKPAAAQKASSLARADPSHQPSAPCCGNAAVDQEPSRPSKRSGDPAGRSVSGF